MNVATGFFALVLVVVTFGAHADDPVATDEVQFESGSSSFGSIFEPEVDRAAERAMQIAHERREQTFTSERFVIALLVEEDVRNAMTRRGIDLQSVAIDLEAHLSRQQRRTDAGKPPADGSLQRALQRLAVRHLVHGKNRASGLDVLSAIVEQNESCAAITLSRQGFTVEVASDEATERYIERTQRENEELAGLRAKVRDDDGDPIRADVSSVSAQTETPRMLTYMLRVDARESAKNVEFKGAVSQDGRLSLLIETTPFELKLLATRVIVLLEAVGSDAIEAKLAVRNHDGSETSVGGFGGPSGAILQNPANQTARWSSGHF